MVSVPSGTTRRVLFWAVGSCLLQRHWICCNRFIALLFYTFFDFSYNDIFIIFVELIERTQHLFALVINLTK